VPFIRYTRDKRGYETTFVMHGYRPAQGPQRTRVLYLFRAPSHIRMGRRPLDDEAREALEHTHPDLSFDWSALDRESADVRGADHRDRDRDRDRDGGRPRRGAPQGRPKPPAAPPLVVDDQSLLGRTLGGATAARYRARYSELLERITRRARTPEERDRLTEAAQRLNPDDWPDAEAVRAHAQTIEAEWDAVAAELPARRRGRRGGRRRESPAEGATTDTAAADADDASEDAADDTPGSAIMTSDGEGNASQDPVVSTRPADTGDPGGDAGGLRTDTGDDTPGRRDGLPGDDEFRPD